MLEEVRDKAVKNSDGKPTHILIEGDNYHALTCLNYTHRGKIDVIYIDPPYNTGNDGFTYKDARFLTEFPDGAKIDKNHPLRHSAWLSFMAKRLELAKNLLSERGVIFISIDDNEQANLKLLCDNVFGEGNFLGEFIWRKKSGGGQADAFFVTEHEYVFVYRKSTGFVWIDPKESLSASDFKNSDERGFYNIVKLEKWGNTAHREDRPSMYFPIKKPSGEDYFPVAPDGKEGRWRVGATKMKVLIANCLIEWRNGIPYEKKYFSSSKADVKILKSRSILYSAGETGDGTKILTSIMGEKDVFENPKPVSLIQELISHNDKFSLILDFFAGSGTTMHATMKLNAEDGGKRQCILVTNNENQICEKVTYERNRRVMCGYVNSKGENVAGLGNSMKYYRTAFVGGNDAKNALDRDKRELSRKAGALLSLAENTLEELSVPEAEAAYFQIFSDGKYRFTAVYFTLDWTHLDALAGTLKTLSAQTRGKARFAVYVYSDGLPDIFEDDLADVPGATLKAIPQPILEIYKTINGGK